MFSRSKVLIVGLVGVSLNCLTPLAMAQEGFALEEIVVTATKRESSLQSTPIAVSAFSQQALDDIGAHDVQSLADSIPTLVTSQGSDSAVQISMRGITSTNNTELGDPSVSFNLDGVYQPRPQAATASMHDIERVEVLRGPQGTLFGRNSPAGAINIITAKPGDELEGSIGVTLGDYNQQGLRGTFNLPVSDTFALRAALNMAKHDGFVEAGSGSAVAGISDENLPFAQDDLSLRLSSLWTPTDNFSWLVAVDSFSADGTPPLTFSEAVSDDPWLVDLKGPFSSEVEIMSIRSKIDWSLSDNIGLSYIVGYNELTRVQSNPGPVGGVGTFTDNSNDSLSHEIQLKSQGSGPLEWIAGYFYLEEETYIDFLVDITPVFGLRFLQPERSANSDAVFGQVTYNFSDSFSMNLGARKSNDEKEDVAGGTFVCPAGIANLNACFRTADNTRSSEWSAPTFRIDANWETEKYGLVYISAASGYKSGGFAAGGTPNYDEETVLTYEIGNKAEFLDGKLRLNSAVFFSDYDDLQVSQVTAVAGGGSILSTRNAASAEISGLEVEFTWLPTDNDRFTGYVSLLDASVEEFPNGVDSVFDPGTALDLAGNKLIRSPESSFNLAYEHQFNLSGGGTLRPRVALSWKDDQWLRIVNRPVDDLVESHSILDASLRYDSADETWSVELFGKNLTDEVVRTQGTALNGAGALNYGYRQPKTFGIRYNHAFGK